MEKTFFLLVLLLPMCGLFFQTKIKEPIDGLQILSGSITKIEPTGDINSNQL